jgi:hypothetical protein
MLFDRRAGSFSRPLFVAAGIVLFPCALVKGDIIINQKYPINGPTGTSVLSPPTVVPTDQCSQAVQITSFVPGATINVYLTATLAGPVSPKKRVGGPVVLVADGMAVNLTQRLNYGDQLEATQTVNGSTSALSAPMTAGPMLKSLPQPTVDGKNIFACGVVVPVYNLEPGVTVQVFDQTSGSTAPIGTGSTPNDWGSNWDPVVTSKLAQGHQIYAKQLACNGATSNPGPTQPVLASPAPPPEPQVVNAIVGNNTVTLSGLFTGAIVQLFNGSFSSPLNGTSAATTSSNYFVLSAPLTVSDHVLPRQTLCQPSTGTKSYPTTNSIPPPVLVGPICPASSSVTVRNSTVNAALVLLLNGVPAGYGGAGLGDVTLNIAPPAVFATGNTVQIAEYFTNPGSPPPALSNKITVGCTVHTRQDVSTLTPAQLASFARGVQVMMQRSFNNPNDPTGWTYQANMHSTLMSSGMCPMGDASNPLWDQCQHYSDLFFPWHRMYLYYFERILRAASGDPNLTLPYWNYESASEQTLPSAFLTPATPCSQVTLGSGGYVFQLGNPSAHSGCNPLYLPLRAMDTPMVALAPGAADDSVAMADIGFEPSMGGNFGGGPPPGPCHFDVSGMNQGDLENQPHDVIHGQVGGIMGETTQSGNDPIFFLHHTEIDHLWKRWLALGGGRANPTSDSTWMNTSFTFYDETGNVVTLSVKDALDTVAQLDYRYDDDPQVKGQSGRPATPSQVTKQFAPAQAEPLPVTAPTGINLSAGNAQAQITLPPDTRSKIANLMRDKRTIYLSLRIDHIKNTGGVFYEVYANLPANQTPARQSIYFVGNLGFFTSWDGSVTKAINLTQSLRALEDKKAWNGSQLTLTFVPRGPVDARTKRPLPLQPGVRAVIERIGLVGR